MIMFRKLTQDKESEFRKWARDNYKQLEPIEGIWHPVIQDECSKMNAELQEVER